MFGSDRVLTLDIGASKLAMAEFALLRGGLELTRYATTSLGADPDSEADASAFVVSGIHELLRTKGFTPGPVMVSISGQAVFPRYVKLPPVASEKIPQIVRYEAQQNVPFPIDEVVWDYQIVGQEADGLSVMLVAVKNDFVRNWMACVEAAGLEPETVDVSPFALYNAVRYNYADLPGCAMILDIGARTTNIVFVEGDRIFSRSIPVAGIAMTKDLMKEFDLPYADAEQLKRAHGFVGFGGAYEGHEVGVADRASKIIRNVMTRLHAEISRTINFYRSQQGGSQPTMALLAGGASVMPHTDTFLKDKLKINVEYLNPFRNVAVGENISAEEIGRDIHLLGEVVGLGLRRALSCPVEINLLPPEMAARRTFMRRLPFLGLAAVGLAMIMMVFWVYTLRMRSAKEERRRKTEAMVAALAAPNVRLSAIQREQEAVLAQAADLAGLVRSRTRWAEIIGDIRDRLPAGAWLTALRPVVAETPAGEAAVAAERIEIHGRAFSDKVSHEKVSELAQALKSCRHFADAAEIKLIRPVKGTDYAMEFILEAPLRATGAGEPAAGMAAR